MRGWLRYFEWWVVVYSMALIAPNGHTKQVMQNKRESPQYGQPPTGRSSTPPRPGELPEQPPAGEPSADPETWLEEHGDYLYAYAMQRLRDPDRAEELVQETLLTGLRQRETFAGRSSLRTWLCGILRFKILQHLGRMSVHESTADDSALQEAVERQYNRRGIWQTGPKQWSNDSKHAPSDQEFYQTFQRCLDK